jgi:N-acyl homoserine lactone hydrolase
VPQAMGVSPGRFGLLRAILPVFLAASCASRFPDPVVFGGTAAETASLPEIAPCALFHEVRSRPKAFGVAGISLRRWEQPIATILVPHPGGPVLVDPGHGQAVAEDLAAAPWWFRVMMGRGRGARPLGEALVAIGLDPAAIERVAITHVHWDHVGGVRDLPAARVHLSSAELAFYETRSGYLDHGVMPHHLDVAADRLRPFDFDGPPYEGFGASHDLLGDGTLVAVPLPGHTPGSAGWFVNSGDGRRWLLVGDAAWTLDGIARPAHKSRLVRSHVDGDHRQVAETLALLNHLFRHRPEIEIVVAHDLSTYGAVPDCAVAYPGSR